nr:uncharacterized protein LOC123765359 [Procambarus clarkii]
MTTQGEEGKTQLQAMLGSLDTVNTAQEVFMTINEVDQCNMEVENWLRKCQELFPDVKTVHTSVKVQETIREALEMMTTETVVISQDIELHFEERKPVLRFIGVPQGQLLTLLNIQSTIVA